MINSSPAFRMPTRMHLVDLIRLFAASAVWLFHACYLDPVFHGATYQVDQTLSVVARYGYLGVTVFFMISGFVIAASACGRTRFSFAIARFSRLYPAFITCLVATLVALYCRGYAFTSAQMLANLTMLPKLLGQQYFDDVYWSLMFEILFYSYVCILLIGPQFSERLRTFATCWLILSLIHLYLPVPLKTLLILDWAPYFCVGCFTWLITDNVKKWDVAFLIASIAVASLITALNARWGDPFIAGAIIATIAIAFPVLTRIKLAKSLEISTLIAGAISYPLYLIHNVYGSWIAKATGNFALSIVIKLS